MKQENYFVYEKVGTDYKLGLNGDRELLIGDAALLVKNLARHLRTYELEENTYQIKQQALARAYDFHCTEQRTTRNGFHNELLFLQEELYAREFNLDEMFYVSVIAEVLERVIADENPEEYYSMSKEENLQQTYELCDWESWQNKIEEDICNEVWFDNEVEIRFLLAFSRLVECYDNYCNVEASKKR